MSNLIGIWNWKLVTDERQEFIECWVEETMFNDADVAEEPFKRVMKNNGKNDSHKFLTHTTKV